MLTTLPRPAHARASSRRGPVAVVLAVLVGLLASGGLVWRGTSAAFTATTSNGVNNWTLGTVALSDDDSNAAMFTASGLAPGATGNKCIKVSYTGNVAASVKLYAASFSDANSVAQYLDITIEQGTGGGFSTCTGFATGSTVFTGTLASFNTTKTNFGTGVGAWTTLAGPDNRTYRITYTLNAATPDSAQGRTTSTTFQWESQST